jgi:hypothetical protein
VRDIHLIRYDPDDNNENDDHSYAPPSWYRFFNRLNGEHDDHNHNNNNKSHHDHHHIQRDNRGPCKNLIGHGHLHFPTIYLKSTIITTDKNHQVISKEEFNNKPTKISTPSVYMTNK